jgi:hypothetical protein
MASDLYTSSTQFRADMNHFNDITVLQGFPPSLALVDRAVQDLAQVSPVQMQVSLVCIQIALARLSASWGIKPVTGHSLGEYAAMQVSGVLSVSDTIHPAFDFYGLVCPFINSPENYICSFEEKVQLYLRAVRKHQPHGPYHFVGMSIGGILAYEAGKQLIEAGEEVASVLMPDCPCPVMLPPMPPPLIDYLDLIFFGTDAMSSEVSEKRLKSTMHRYKHVEKLLAYKPVPLSAAANAPQTLIVWAQNGTRDLEKDPELDFTYSKDDPRGIVRWILDPWTEFDPYGWDTLLPVAKMVLKMMAGNHYNMDHPPYVSFLSLGSVIMIAIYSKCCARRKRGPVNG